MPQSMPNTTRPAVGLFANRRVPHICPNLADVGRAEGPSRLSRNFRSAVAHRSRKYFRVTCVDDFYFRFKYITAAPSRGASYAFENKIESRNYCRVKCVAPTRKNAAPWNQIPAHRQGVEGRGGGGPTPHYFCQMARVGANSSSQGLLASSKFCGNRRAGGSVSILSVFP
jgi:hypothetical protein